jgi:predicted PurR-regulated permease PerM
MSRFARGTKNGRGERSVPGGNGQLGRTIASPKDSPEEIDHGAMSQHGARTRRRRTRPLRFFPHHFPVPTTLYGVLMVSAGALLVGILMYDVRAVLSPVLLALFAGVFLWPFRAEPKIRPLLVVGSIVLVLWIAVTAFSVLVPFLAAFLLAYIVDPVVTKLQRRFYIKRWILALVASLMLVSLIAVVAGYMVPVLIAQIGTALGAIDRITDSFLVWARSGGLTRLTGIPQPKAQMIIERYVVPRISGLEAMVFSQANEMSQRIPGAISSIISALTNVVMIPFLMFYLIKDYWHIRATIYSFIPQEYQVRSQRMLNDMHEVVGGYLRGDLITSLFQGLFIGVGLAIIGVPGALLLGVVTGVLALIPFLGAIIAWGLVLLTALSMPDPMAASVWVTILFAAQSVIETTIIGPHVMGRHTDLHPLVVMSSLLLFGYFMGLPGMLVAIPITGLLLRGAFRWRERRRAEIEREKVEADLKENPHHAKRGEQPDEALDAMAGPKGRLP